MPASSFFVRNAGSGHFNPRKFTVFSAMRLR
jgi:hypothetical protein